MEVVAVVFIYSHPAYLCTLKKQKITTSSLYMDVYDLQEYHIPKEKKKVKVFFFMWTSKPNQTDTSRGPAPQDRRARCNLLLSLLVLLL